MAKEALGGGRSRGKKKAKEFEASKIDCLGRDMHAKKKQPAWVLCGSSNT